MKQMININKKFITILWVGILFASVVSVNANNIHKNIDDGIKEYLQNEGILYYQNLNDSFPKYNVALGPFIYLWLDANLSTNEFVYFRYGQDNNHVLLYVEFLKEDVNDESYIKWGSLVNDPDINPSFFNHTDRNLYKYYWIQIDKTNEKIVEYSNGRIHVKASGFKGIILISCEVGPIHDLEKPRSPAIIGSFKGKPEIGYEYTFFSRSYTENDLFYYIDWGDGTNTGWIGPYKSCEAFTLNHTWKYEGFYKIDAKAKDILGSRSSSTSFDILIKNNSGSRSKQLQILNKIFNSFSSLKWLLHF